MCERCGWEDFAGRAKDVATALPDWKTRSKEFFNSVAESIGEMEHVTPKQMACIEEAEDKLE